MMWSNESNVNAVYLNSSEDREERHHVKARKTAFDSDASSNSFILLEDSVERTHSRHADPFLPFDFDNKESPLSPTSSVSSDQSHDSIESDARDFLVAPTDIADPSLSPSFHFDNLTSLSFLADDQLAFDTEYGIPTEHMSELEAPDSTSFDASDIILPLRLPGQVVFPISVPVSLPLPQNASQPISLPLPGASSAAIFGNSNEDDDSSDDEPEDAPDEGHEDDSESELKLLPTSCASSFGHRDGTKGSILIIREDRPSLLAIYHPEALEHCKARGSFEVIFHIPDDTRSFLVEGKKMQENGVKIQVPRLAPRLVRKCPPYPASSDLYTVEIRFDSCHFFFPIKSRVKN